MRGELGVHGRSHLGVARLGLLLCVRAGLRDAGIGLLLVLCVVCEFLCLEDVPPVDSFLQSLLSLSDVDVGRALGVRTLGDLAEDRVEQVLGDVLDVLLGEPETATHVDLVRVGCCDGALLGEVLLRDGDGCPIVGVVGVEQTPVILLLDVLDLAVDVGAGLREDLCGGELLEVEGLFLLLLVDLVVDGSAGVECADCVRGAEGVALGISLGGGGLLLLGLWLDARCGCTGARLCHDDVHHVLGEDELVVLCGVSLDTVGEVLVLGLGALLDAGVGPVFRALEHL